MTTAICVECETEVAIGRFCSNCGELLLQQNIRGDNSKSQNATLTDSGNIQQNIADGDINTTNIKIVQNNSNNNEQVNYIKHTGEIHTTNKLLSITGAISIPGIALGGFNLLGSASSIISFLSTPDDPTSKLIWTLIIIFSFIIILAASAIATITALIGLVRLQLGHHVPITLHRDKFLEKLDNGNYQEVWFTAPCKTGKCGGTLTVKKSPANEDGVDYIGICNKNSKQHHYTFDETEKTGKPIKLTPKKDQPKNNNS